LLNEIKQRKIDTNKQAVNSAAMQDHLMKKFKVGGVDPFKKPPAHKAATRQSAQHQTSAGLQNSGLQVLGVNSSMHSADNSSR